MRSALIIGADSLIGSALADRLQTESVAVHCTTRRKGRKNALHLDLADSADCWQLPKTDVTYLCAGITKLEACEADPEGTFHINVHQMQQLAQERLAQKSRMVFISTSQVFDGTQGYREAQEPVCPVSAYGRQKAAFETWLLAQQQPACVLRLTKVVGKKLPILHTWEQALRAGKTIEAFTDLVFAPLGLACVQDALELLGSQPSRGVFQLSGTHDISYHEIAVALAMHLKANKSQVTPVRGVEKGIHPSFLPQQTTLKNSAIFASLAIPEPLQILGLAQL